MAKGEQKFRTGNLDLACVLLSQGYACQTKKLGPVSAEFVFAKDEEVVEMASRFYRGECHVNITSFMYARFALKRELAMKSVEWIRQKEGKMTLSHGQFYYYIAEDGKAYRNVYANREPHVSRVIAGNAYHTMNEAQAAASNVKTD